MVVGHSPTDVYRPVLVDEPRLITENDIFWVVWLGRKKYPKNYDPAGAEGWLRNIVLKNPMMFFAERTQNAFCVSMMSVKPWTPSEQECNIAAFCCDDDAMWEGMKLIRDSIEWARNRKCVSWTVNSDTENDFTMLARRVGATELSPRFSIRL